MEVRLKARKKLEIQDNNFEYGCLIPEITEEEAFVRHKKIKQVMRMQFMQRFKSEDRLGFRYEVNAGGQLMFSKQGELYYVSSIVKNPCISDCLRDFIPGEMAVGLKKLKDIATYHSYGYNKLFRPAIVEVLAQIPEEFLERTTAFELINYPQKRNYRQFISRHYKAYMQGYFAARTRLYTKE